MTEQPAFRLPAIPQAIPARAVAAVLDTLGIETDGLASCTINRSLMTLVYKVITADQVGKLELHVRLTEDEPT